MSAKKITAGAARLLAIVEFLVGGVLAIVLVFLILFLQCGGSSTTCLKSTGRLRKMMRFISVKLFNAEFTCQAAL